MAGSAPDVVIPVRKGDDNDELRYTLRGIDLHVPHRRVWIAGYCPAWVSDQAGRIPTVQGWGKWGNVMRALLAACEHPDVAEQIVRFDDDMFVMRPIDQVPALHRGPVSDLPPSSAGPVPLYREGLGQTAKWLCAEYGVDEPLSYDLLHSPIPMGKAALEYVIQALADTGIAMPAIRTAYGNIMQVGGLQAGDAKVRTFLDTPPDQATYVSTVDATFERGAVGRWVRERLPTPCRYEG